MKKDVVFHVPMGEGRVIKVDGFPNLSTFEGARTLAAKLSESCVIVLQLLNFVDSSSTHFNWTTGKHSASAKATAQNVYSMKGYKQ